MARCEHDAVMAGANNEMMFLNIKALNEWDSKVSEENDLYSYEHRETGYNHTCMLICGIARATLLICGTSLMEEFFCIAFTMK